MRIKTALLGKDVGMKVLYCQIIEPRGGPMTALTWGMKGGYGTDGAAFDACAAITSCTRQAAMATARMACAY